MKSLPQISRNSESMLPTGTSVLKGSLAGMEASDPIQFAALIL